MTYLRFWVMTALIFLCGAVSGGALMWAVLTA